MFCINQLKISLQLADYIPSAAWCLYGEHFKLWCQIVNIDDTG